MFICFGILAVLLLVYFILALACGFDLQCGKSNDTTKRLLFEEEVAFFEENVSSFNDNNSIFNRISGNLK